MMDSVDKQIIEILRNDAKLSSKELAKQLNISSSTVRRRVKNLIDSGTLRIVAIPDPVKVGFPLTAVLAFDVSIEKIELAVQMLVTRPEVSWVSTTAGRFDIIALARFRSTDELSQFLQKDLLRMEGLKNTETFLCLHMEKSFLQPQKAFF